MSKPQEKGTAREKLTNVKKKKVIAFAVEI